jgi:hypothetical protein
MRDFISRTKGIIKTYPLASFFFTLAVFFYWYEGHVSKFLYQRNQLHVVDRDGSWFLTATICDSEIDYNGTTNLDCEDVDVYGPFQSEIIAIEEQLKIMAQLNKKLEKADFLNLRIAGTWLIDFSHGLLGIFAFFAFVSKRSKLLRKNRF